jgi:hypothetical protein
MTPEPPEDWLDVVAGRKADPEMIRRLRQPGRLTEPERRRLEAELAFNELLDGHRPPPVSSNFTARVLARIEQDERVVERRVSWWDKIGWIPRVAAFAVVALTFGLLWSQGAATRQARMAKQAVELGRAASVPGLEAASLADFEVIRRIGVAPRAEDDALILALAQ